MKMLIIILFLTLTNAFNYSSTGLVDKVKETINRKTISNVVDKVEGVKDNMSNIKENDSDN